VKLTRYVLALLMLFALTFAAACGSDDDDGDEPSGGSTPAATSAASPEATKASGELILATTTSFQDSGLLDILAEKFEDESGYNLTAVAVGSGAAIEQGARGDADVVFAHSPTAEKKMVDDGNGIERTLVMHNDYVIVGPAADPSAVKASTTINEAMTALATGGAQFISRGDESGTHTFELKLWKGATIDHAGQSWYEETGQGMGATLQVANQKLGYTLSDRGTFLAQKANLDLEILFENDGAMLNYYHVIVVNPETHSGVNVAAARAFAAFLVRADVQAIIEEFGVAEFGEPLFYPDAGKPEPS
jgi:tungstate transport system substrate-binding protein